MVPMLPSACKGQPDCVAGLVIPPARATPAAASGSIRRGLRGSALSAAMGTRISVAGPLPTFDSATHHMWRYSYGLVKPRANLASP